MSDAAAALRAGVAELLRAQGDAETSALVGASEVIVLAPEAWSVGSRIVNAHRVALLLDAVPFAALVAAPARIARLRAAFEDAMKSPETALADLSLLLRLPALRRAWGHAYRDLPEREPDGAPDAAAVLAGAAALLSARGDPAGAEILTRAEAESAEVPASGHERLRRWVLRLEPADLVRAQRSTDLADRLKTAVTAAATRASESVATVALVAALATPPERSTDGVGRLQRALESRGGAVVVVSRAPGLTTLAWVAGGEVCLIDVTRASRPVESIEAEVRRVVVDVGELADDEAADRIAAALEP